MAEANANIVKGKQIVLGLYITAMEAKLELFVEPWEAGKDRISRGGLRVSSWPMHRKMNARRHRLP